jgi:hypothetical protein
VRPSIDTFVESYLYVGMQTATFCIRRRLYRSSRRIYWKKKTIYRRCCAIAVFLCKKKSSDNCCLNACSSVLAVSSLFTVVSCSQARCSGRALDSLSVYV